MNAFRCQIALQNKTINRPRNYNSALGWNIDNQTVRATTIENDAVPNANWGISATTKRLGGPYYL